MISSNPDILLDLTSILPGHGENRVESRFRDGNLEVAIFYDGAHQEEQITFTFGKVVCHHITRIPGPEFSRVEVANSVIDQLVAFRFSDIAEAWNQHLGKRTVRHYYLFCSTEGIRIDVLGESAAF